LIDPLGAVEKLSGDLKTALEGLTPEQQAYLKRLEEEAEALEKSKEALDEKERAAEEELRRLMERTKALEDIEKLETATIFKRLEEHKRFARERMRYFQELETRTKEGMLSMTEAIRLGLAVTIEEWGSFQFQVYEMTRQLLESLTSLFGEFFLDLGKVLVGAEVSWRQALTRFLEDVARFLARLAALRAAAFIAELFGLGMGAVRAPAGPTLTPPGAPRPAQHGGLFLRPTVTRIAEAGPELVLPLRGRAGIGPSLQMNVTIQALDAASFEEFAARNRETFINSILASVSASPGTRRLVKTLVV